MGGAAGHVVLNASGVATLTVSRLSAGQHNITASYGGDSANLASQSAILGADSGTGDNRNVADDFERDRVRGGERDLYRSGVTDGHGDPHRLGDLHERRNRDGNGTLDGTGTATLATSALAAGSHSISAIYTAIQTIWTSTSASLGETVQQIPTATTIAASANPGTSGAALVLTATVAQSGTLGAGGAFSAR